MRPFAVVVHFDVLEHCSRCLCFCSEPTVSSGKASAMLLFAAAGDLNYLLAAGVALAFAATRCLYSMPPIDIVEWEFTQRHVRSASHEP